MRVSVMVLLPLIGVITDIGMEWDVMTWNGMPRYDMLWYMWCAMLRCGMLLYVVVCCGMPQPSGEKGWMLHRVFEVTVGFWLRS